MIEEIESIAKVAGERIWQLYESGPVGVETKEDDSPVTVADLEANQIITSRLNQLSRIPVLSEEAVAR